MAIKKKKCRKKAPRLSKPAPKERDWLFTEGTET